MSQRDIERLRALEKRCRQHMDGEGFYWQTTHTAFEALESVADELATLIAELGQEVGAEQAPVADSELPGMWSASDFTGGDPDERCYSDRDLFASNLRSALGKHYDPEAGIVCSVALLAADKNTHPAHTSEARDAARYRALKTHFQAKFHRATCDYWVIVGELKTDPRFIGEDGEQLTLDNALDAAIAAMRQEGE